MASWENELFLLSKNSISKVKGAMLVDNQTSKKTGQKLGWVNARLGQVYQHVFLSKLTQWQADRMAWHFFH